MTNGVEMFITSGEILRLYSKVGCVFPMAFGPDYARGSKETTTIGKTHPTLQCIGTVCF